MCGCVFFHLLLPFLPSHTLFHKYFICFPFFIFLTTFLFVGDVDTEGTCEQHYQLLDIFDNCLPICLVQMHTSLSTIVLCHCLLQVFTFFACSSASMKVILLSLGKRQYVLCSQITCANRTSSPVNKLYQQTLYL